MTSTSWRNRLRRLTGAAGSDRRALRGAGRRFSSVRGKTMTEPIAGSLHISASHRIAVTGVTWVAPTTAELAQLVAKRLFGLRADLGNWRAVAAELKPRHKASAALWWKVAKGESKNVRALNAVLDYYGLPLLPLAVEVMPCPIHGEPHLCDCQGRDGVPAWIAPGEHVVTQPAAERKPRNGITPTRATLEQDARRKRLGVDWRTVYEAD